MKKILIALYVSLACSGLAMADSTASVLAQLGVKGVTDKTQVTNAYLYANYLIKTDSNGLLNVTLLPAGISASALNHVVYIDPLIGGESTNTYNGAITKPWKSFTNAVVRTTNTAVFVFSPGTYTAPTIADPLLSSITLMGSDATNTIITGQLKFTLML